MDGHLLVQTLARRAGVPAGVHLQIADRCNHACVHCYQVQGRKGEMSLADIESILDDLAGAGVMLLNISGGEATLRHDFLDVLRAARRRGFALRLYTNGYSMTEDLARAIREVGVLGVDVSVYSDEPAQHDGITRVPGSWARTIAGVRHLIAAGVRVHLKAPATSRVPDAAARVRRVADALGGDMSVVTSNDITPMENGDLATKALAADPRVLAASGALSEWSPPDDLAAAKGAARAQPSCGACRDGVAVLPNGDLRPCTDIVASLGNLRTARFRDLYARSDAALVSGLVWGDVHGCRDCDLLPACQRCHASAQHEGGDLLGPYASACALSVARYEAAVGHVALLEPAPDCEAGRARTRGPFRIASPGVLEPVPDVVSSEDAARRERFAWIRPTREYVEDMSRGDAHASARRRLPVVGQGGGE